MLYELRALDRIRPWNAPWRYFVDTPGAEILAADDGLPLREFGYRYDRAKDAATSTHTHTLGVNQVFVDLYAHTRNPAHRALALLKFGHREHALALLDELVRTHVTADGRLLNGCYDLASGGSDPARADMG